MLGDRSPKQYPLAINQAAFVSYEFNIQLNTGFSV